MATFTAADGRATAERLSAEQHALAESLIDLEEHSGRELLDNTAVTGLTRQRRKYVLDGIATVWIRYENCRSAVARIRAIVEGCRPAQDDLSEAERLVTEATNDLATIHTLYGEINEVIVAANQVWTELTPRIEDCDALLREAESLVAELKLASHDPIAELISTLTDQLGGIRQIAVADPLRLWTGQDAVATTQVDQLIARCQQAHGDLQVLVEVRKHARRRLDQVHRTLAEVHQLEREITKERRAVNTKIVTAPGGEPRDEQAVLLGARLAAASEHYRHARWRRLGAELQAVERDAAAALARAQAELVEAGRPLRERAELRGRLSAYRVKASALGRIEDLELERQYQQARELLWRAPCDLAAAAAAVRQYQNAVNETPASGDVA